MNSYLLIHSSRNSTFDLRILEYKSASALLYKESDLEIDFTLLKSCDTWTITLYENVLISRFLFYTIQYIEYSLYYDLK